MELVHADGSVDTIDLSPDELRARYDAAYDTASTRGFHFESLRLTPQPKLVEIVKRSRELALDTPDPES